MKKYHHSLSQKLLSKVKPPVPGRWRVLVTGVTSIHGWPIFRLLSQHLDSSQLFGVRPPKMTVPDQTNVMACCITDRDCLKKIKARFNPTHIIYGSGVCDLDACEDKPAWARAINVGGVEAVAEVFGQDCSILFLSTDLVFSGHTPPVDGYGEDNRPDPVSVVGKTFAEAEQVIRQLPDWTIIRLGLPTGDSITGDKGAVDFIERRFKRGLPLTLFFDEVRSCIECEELAVAVFWVLIKKLKGLYHLGGDEKESLYGLGKEIISKGPYEKNLLDTKSYKEDYGGPPRIGDVSLNATKLNGLLQLVLNHANE